MRADGSPSLARRPAWRLPRFAAPAAAPASVAEALRLARLAADFLNSPAAAEVPGPSCGEVLTGPG